MSELDLLAVAIAGFFAGAVNAVAGGGSLISFPALVAVGCPPLSANATNTVALVPGYLGGSIGYRAELAGQGQRLRAFGLTSIAGAIVGAVLLLISPAEVFKVLAPFLILGACGLLFIQPHVQRLRARADESTGAKAIAAQFGTAIYGAYFGAGVGIMMLATFGLLVRDDLQRLNALKGALSLIISLVAAVAFAFAGRVAWSAAAAMAVASLAGGRLGVAPARRLREAQLRTLVLVVGITAAVWLLVG